MARTDEIKKIALKIKTNKKEKVFAITALDKKENTYELAEDLARELNLYGKTILIDLQSNESENFLTLEDIKNDKIRNKQNLDMVSFEEKNIDKLVNTEEFIEFLKSLKENYSNIIINNGYFDSYQAYLLKNFEDGEIILVNEGKSKKSSLEIYLKGLEKLEIELLGVVYNK